LIMKNTYLPLWSFQGTSGTAYSRTVLQNSAAYVQQTSRST
jgi:hypothetical protein